MNDTGGLRTPPSIALPQAPRRSPRALRSLRAGLAVVMVAASLLASTAPAAAMRTPNGPDSVSVYRLYRAAFLREPDAGGLAYWYRAQLDGMPLADIAEHFASSPELVARYGRLDDATFVEQMYDNVFGRAADAVGAHHWAGALAEGRLTRGDVLLAFADSAEHKSAVLAAAAGPVDPDSYAFERWSPDGTPETWNPCVPVEVVFNPEHAPPWAEEWINVALLRMSDATGVPWRLRGTTTEWYPYDSLERQLFDVESEDFVFAPILIQWDPALGSLTPDGGVHGTHQVVSVLEDQHSFTATARLVLGPGSSTSPRQLVGVTTHLLSRIYGLAPVEVPGNVMHRSWSAAGWGTGDLEGFRQLHPGGCVVA